MSSYYAKATASAMGGEERLIAVTGQFRGGLLRVVDVDIKGNAIADPTYMPANLVISEMVIGSSGQLIDKIDSSDEEEIDWAAHEDKPGDIAEDEAAGTDEDFIPGEGKPNPMLAAIPKE